VIRISINITSNNDLITFQKKKKKSNDLNKQKSHANNVFHFSIFPVFPSPFKKKKKKIIMGIEMFDHLFKKRKKLVQKQWWVIN
jgi:hypothetical protein